MYLLSDTTTPLEKPEVYLGSLSPAPVLLNSIQAEERTAKISITIMLSISSFVNLQMYVINLLGGILKDMSLARQDPGVAFTAGFPNAAVDAVDTPLDLNELVVKSPASTFYMRVDGDQWSEMNIHAGDVLVVDRALEMKSKDLIVAQIEGELIMRRYFQRGPRHYLIDAEGTEVQMESDLDFQLWGVVTYSFHKQRSDS